MCLPKVFTWLSWKRRLQKLKSRISESSKMKINRGKEVKPETIDYLYFNELNDNSSIVDLFPRINIVENVSAKEDDFSSKGHSMESETNLLQTGSSSFDDTYDNDSSFIRILDSTKKEWITRARQNDTSSMTDLLRFYPELVRSADPISGYTALHWAAKHGNYVMVQILTDNNLIQIDKRSKGGYTALHLAQNFQHPEIADFLSRECNANISVRDNYGFKSHQYGKRKEYNSLLLRVLF